MSSSRLRPMMIRQWEIVTALCGRRRGLTVPQIAERVGASRATAYRDIKILQNAGVPLDAERVNGEKRYRLGIASIPQLVPSALQIAALHVARRMLEPLDGTSLVTEFDLLLSRYASLPAAALDTLSLGPTGPAGQRQHNHTIQRAIEDGKRVELDYHSVRAAQPALRTVDPVGLHVHDGHLYLIAWDLDRDDWRTFKLPRIHRVAILDESARPHPEYDPETLFGHAAGVWTGDPVSVAIRLTARVARFVTEWPLTGDQTIESRPDGSIVVRAEVAGTIEAMRWTLRWGQDAEALAPPELRQQVKEQLTAALARYDEP